MALTKVIPGLGRVKIDDKFGTVFITSGTGVIGYRVALSLLEAGVKSVRVGIWSGDRQVCCSLHVFSSYIYIERLLILLTLPRFSYCFETNNYRLVLVL